MQMAMQILRKEKRERVEMKWHYYNMAMTPPTKKKVKKLLKRSGASCRSWIIFE